ncbi:hypothetical protein K469DRAFT_342015 [Zopfia rhizophila CBS 207.26]|uniref:Uncharacterized protein n=1 Tax=Zopfia rhizophila CBS 207.26 TaxID=1314779 RepID=A0A6A6EKV2_9PEZI|nr:hypothetical protein K469DRAFT_342015 [Zopfia rhizophila CBS 207.26]
MCLPKKKWHVTDMVLEDEETRPRRSGRRYYTGRQSRMSNRMTYYYYPTTTAAPAATPVPTAAAPTTYTYTYAYPATSSTSHYAYAAPSARYVTYGHTCGHARHTCSLASHHTRDEVELNHRYLATTRGAYDAKKIKPVCEPGDLLWCREKDGTWNLRSFYNIENDCQPGRWTMDAEKGFCVFHRE